MTINTVLLDDYFSWEMCWFTDEQLMFSIVNIFTGGTESTASTLLWGMIHLVRFPDVQRKVHKEIDAVLNGEERLITLQDRSNLQARAVNPNF